MSISGSIVSAIGPHVPWSTFKCLRQSLCSRSRPYYPIMLQQRITVCFGKAARQHAGPTRAIILGRSCDFAKYTFCAKLPLTQLASNGRSQPKADMAISRFGQKLGFRRVCEIGQAARRNRTFMAKICLCSYAIVARAGRSPIYRMLQLARMLTLKP